MSDKIIDMKDRVNPARVTDHDTGTVYELDFTRESVSLRRTVDSRLTN